MPKAAPAPLSASLLAVAKGAATPVSDPVSETAGQGLQSEPVPVKRLVPEIAPPPTEEPRTALTVRLPISTQERLREAAHRTRKEKQAIVDQALAGWLDAHGF